MSQWNRSYKLHIYSTNNNLVLHWTASSFFSFLVAPRPPNCVVHDDAAFQRTQSWSTANILASAFERLSRLIDAGSSLVCHTHTLALVHARSSCLNSPWCLAVMHSLTCDAVSLLNLILLLTPGRRADGGVKYGGAKTEERGGKFATNLCAQCSPENVKISAECED